MAQNAGGQVAQSTSSWWQEWFAQLAGCSKCRDTVPSAGESMAPDPRRHSDLSGEPAGPLTWLLNTGPRTLWACLLSVPVLEPCFLISNTIYLENNLELSILCYKIKFYFLI